MSSLSLSLVLAASLGPNGDGKISAASPGADAAPSRGVGLSAQFTWADVDGDGQLELGALSGDGKLRLLAPASGDRFEDASERLGVAGVDDAALVLWSDYDADGRMDLFVGARVGRSRLFRNVGGVLEDWSEAAGLALEGAVQSATWLDHDGNGRLDLAVVTAEESAQCLTLFRGLEGGFFERTEITELAGMVPELPVGSVLPDVVGGSSPTGDRALEVRSPRIAPAPGAPIPFVTSGSTSGGVTALQPFPIACADSVRDQANPGTCLSASTTPTLGRLYPLSTNLFVAVTGEVGIGTTSPGSRLHVAGTAQIMDTLTLAPLGDQALAIDAGSIYKDRALFIHTHGTDNLGAGREALASVTTGHRNAAFGWQALRSNTSGNENTASGAYALRSNTTGSWNVASGTWALRDNSVGTHNTASGSHSLKFNTTGSNNTASGTNALRDNTTGNTNTASGSSALLSNTEGFSNTAIGFEALRDNTTGTFNTATGEGALRNNTTASENVANGHEALSSNTTGSSNAAVGAGALYNNTTGNANTAIGSSALTSTSSGSFNIAVGSTALFNNTGSANIAIGFGAGQNLTTGNGNIAIGHMGFVGETATIRIGSSQSRAFLAGVRGVTTGVANAIPVLVDSSGQLGTISSSRRFKEEIHDMGDATEHLLALRPVTFRYKPEVQAGERPLEYGLIAEEVAEVFPDLVVYDEDGKPFTVKYHLLSSMLLNELQELDERTRVREDELGREIEELRRQVAALADIARPAASPR